MRVRLAGFASGLLFAVGLGVAGMTRPSKVLGFLDLTGAWDPSLGLVMAGAVLVALVAFRLSRRLAAPLWGDRFAFPVEARVDGRLVGGAAIFGVGWGLSGYCPGPAIVSLPTLAPWALVFVGGMVGGMLGARLVERRAGLASAAEADPTCG